MFAQGASRREREYLKVNQVLSGLPSKVTAGLLARFLPLRDSQAHAEPEIQRLRLLKGAGGLLLLGGGLLEVGLLLSGSGTAISLGFGLVVLVVGGVLYRAGCEAPRFVPPEPLENLAALSQALGLSRGMEKHFPEGVLQLDPLDFRASSSYDGYDWELSTDREALRPIHGKFGGSYRITTELAQEGAGRIWRRSAPTAIRHRIVWHVKVEGTYSPRAGKPSEHTALESHETQDDSTVISFALPIVAPDKHGLGHEGRTDYVSTPFGLHHPEFVGEQIAQSLAWMFKRSL